MGILKKPKYSDYWSTDPILATPLFPKIMTRNRFMLLLCFWHFADNANAPDPNDCDRDRMYKVQAMITHLNTKFAEALQPQREICLDESILLFKGRLHFKIIYLKSVHVLE